MNKRLSLPLALALALGSSSALALGLGQIEVKSALNQPLEAEIPVISSVPGEADQLAVRLAPPEALARIGLQAPTGVAANLQLALDTNSRGQTVIKVTTLSKVADPYLTFLLEVDWGKGRMLREYTVLLDPPTLAPVRHTSAAAPVSELPPPLVEEAEVVPLVEAPPPPPMTEPAEPVTESMPAAEPATPSSEPEIPSAASATEPVTPDEPQTRVDTYGPVAQGETLWSIAQFARPDDTVSMNQMMIALLYANPDAFIGQNINLLKRGAILRIPAREEALAVAAAEAAAQVREQTQIWRQTAASVTQPAEPQADETSSPRPSTRPTSVPDSRLELVPPRGDVGSMGSAQSGAAVDGAGRELRAELARNREELNTLRQENVELQSRVGELEQIRGDSQRLIELKDSELAAAQRRLAEIEARAAAADIEPTAQSTTAPAEPAPTSVTPQEVAEPLVNSTTPSADTAPSADAVTPAPVESTPSRRRPPPRPAVSSTPTPAVSTPSPTPAPPPRSEPFYLNPLFLGGVALVVVGLLALLLGRRRKATAGVGSTRYDSGTPASRVTAAKGGSGGRTASASDKHNEDPVAALMDAVVRDPGNLTRHLELVRHYYDSSDAAGFENAAEAMYARVYDPEDMAWKQVVAMGQEIAPEHPLFVVTEAEPEAAFEPTPVPSAKAAREVDWNLPAKTPATPKAPAADPSTTQPMRLDEVPTGRGAFKPEPEPVFESELEAESFSFEPVSEQETSTEGEGLVDADAASTKLELARAYLDMGDVEGARGMLEEVVSEGNPGQRAEAKRLLDEIR